MKLHFEEWKDMNEVLNCYASHGYYTSRSTLEVYYECDPNAFYVAVSNKESKSHKILTF